MKKTVFALLCSIILLAGCVDRNEVKSPPGPQTTNEEKPTTSIQPTNTGDGKEQLVSTYSTKSQDKQLSLYSNSNGNPAIIVKVTENGGKVENRSAIPTQKDWEKTVQKENIFISLQSGSNFSCVLLTSGPAAGLMEKMLYTTKDNGKSWTLVNNVSQVIDGYVTGISFRTEKDGWISATQHGAALVPLYRTIDGGKSWNLQPIDIPQGYKYGNVFPPIFDDKNTKQGTLKIEFISDTDKKSVEFKTTDGGDTWK